MTFSATFCIFSLTHGIWVTLKNLFFSLSLSPPIHTYIIHIKYVCVCVCVCAMCRSVIGYVIRDVSTHPRTPHVRLHYSDNLKPRSLKSDTAGNTEATISTQNLQILHPPMTAH